MSNHQSYQTYIPTPEGTAQAHPQFRDSDTVHSMTIKDGAMSHQAIGTERGNSGELNPYHGTDSFAATARNPNGTPVTELLPTTLVMIDGVQAPVSFWVSEGRLQKGQDGTYSEAAGNPEAQQADTSDHLGIPQVTVTLMDQAAEGVNPANVDRLLALGMRVATGRIEAQALTHHFSQATGQGPENSRARLDVIQKGFQAQADAALTSRAGVGAADLPDFYVWAKANRRDQLQEVIGKQVHTADVSGYEALAAQWLAATPPTLDALRVGGYQVREQGHRAKVFIRGNWMSQSAEAKAGLV